MLLGTGWIARLRESNAVVLMKDDPIRYRPAEQLAFEHARLRGFVLTNGNLRRAQLAADLLENCDTIRRIAEQPGPHLCGVYRTRVERLWP